jgi:hypothetical protein
MDHDPVLRVWSVPESTPQVQLQCVAPCLLAKRDDRIHKVQYALRMYMIEDLVSMVMAYDGDVPVTLVIVSAHHSRKHNDRYMSLWNWWCLQQKVTLCVEAREAPNFASVLAWIQHTDLRDALVVVDDLLPVTNDGRQPLLLDKLNAPSAQEEMRNHCLSIHMFESYAWYKPKVSRHTGLTQPCSCVLCRDGIASVAANQRNGVWSIMLPYMNSARAPLPDPLPISYDTDNMIALLELL